VVVGEDEDLILDCYWLARWYHQNPEVFLNMPISMMRKHLLRTIQVAKRMQADIEDG
jgi:hypothetical protein